MNVNYYGNMKMADLIQADYHLLMLLPRFGLDLGVADTSVEECCKAQSVDVDLFLTVCNVYSFERYQPDDEQIGKLNAKQLIDYLLKSHQYYVERLNSIASRLNVLTDRHICQHCDLLSEFYSGYASEVQKHFEYEEQTVYPYVAKLADGTRIEDFAISKFEDNHTNIDDKLSDLKNIIIKYLHSDIAVNERVGLLFDIFRFEDDLCKHTLIEDKILVPLAQNLEDNRNKPYSK